MYLILCVVDVFDDVDVDDNDDKSNAEDDDKNSNINSINDRNVFIIAYICDHVQIHSIIKEILYFISTSSITYHHH